VRAFSIAWKDIRHTYRNFAGLVMMLLAPLLLAFALGAAFGSGDNFTVAAVKTALVDQDEGAGDGAPSAGAMLTAALTDPALVDLVEVTQVETPEEAKALVDAGDAAVAVIIPPGLSSALWSASGASADVEVQIYKDPTLTAGPAIVATIVQSLAQSLNGARAAAGAAALLGRSQGLLEPAQLETLAAEAAQQFSAAARTGAAATLEERAPQVSRTQQQKKPNVASQVLVGMMLFFMLFGAATPARSILDEHREGTLSRLFTTPTSRGVILGGKYIAVFLVVLLQVTVLVLAGWLLLGADWGGPGPLIVLIVSSSVMAASLGLLTVSFAKTPGQAGAVSSAIFVFLSLISGNFTGSANIGALSTVRRVSPLGWLMEAWTDVLFGGSWQAIGIPVLATLGFTATFFGIATFFFRRRYA
jgi:ABC-2 type transport system permease protein